MWSLEVLGPEPGKTGAEILAEKARLWRRGHVPIIARPSDGLADTASMVRTMTVTHHTLVTILLVLGIICAGLFILRR